MSRAGVMRGHKLGAISKHFHHGSDLNHNDQEDEKVQEGGRSGNRHLCDVRIDGRSLHQVEEE
jgi:hypothetical protein